MSVRLVREALVAALGPGARADHRTNHAGAGKLTFSVRVGERRLWAKVAADRDEDARLATWAAVAGLLTERHAAPPLLDVLEVHGRTALLFAHVDAAPASRAALRRRYDEAARLLAGLHADRELAGLLGAPTTTAACFRTVWLERFEADLEIIEGYVAKDVHAYLAEQVELLGGLVDPLTDEVWSAVHGDPWHENLLIAPDRLWLLDWEELAVGDPVLDDAILVHDALGSDPRHWPDGPTYAVARRAVLLDTVVDVAADWVENAEPLVRRAKEAAYRAALEAYRAEVS
jgi:aminoglycoside phosphotransferase (APT) family kinase protein